MVGHGSVMVAALTPAASVIVWGLVLMGVLVLVGSALELGRRRWLASSQRRSEARGGGFSIERVEALHRRGLISDEEFQRLRRQALGLPTVGRAPPSGSSSPPAGDDGNAGRNG